MTSDAHTNQPTRWGPRSEAVQQVLHCAEAFTPAQHVIMVRAYEAVRFTSRHRDWDEARDAVTAAADASDRDPYAWDVRMEAHWSAGARESWEMVDDADQAELIADLIPADTYRLLTSLFRLARDHPEWLDDPDLWSFFLELVPNLGIDSAREVIELAALPDT